MYGSPITCDFKMSIDSDYQLALRLQKELCPDFDAVPAKKIKIDHTSIVDSEWERLDPNPDIYILFQTFDKKFFWSSLDSVEVKWSKRMYSCAGICTYKGKRGGCSISLSFPLLQLRPRKDLVETLLHEMIHAYLFLTANKQDREEHGPLFHQHMNRINKTAGTKITVYHTFHDEVAHYKQHWWRCNGPCQHRKPFFGLVKRSMNRAPGPNDFWHAEHKASCGGEFIKIKEPDNFKSRKSKTKPKDTTSLTKYFPKQEPCTPSTSKGSCSDKSRISGVKKKGVQNSKTSPSGVTPLKNYFSQVPSPVKGNKKFGKDSKSKGGSTPKIKTTKSNNIQGFSSFNTNQIKSPHHKNNITSDKSAKVNSTKPNLAGFGAGLKSNKGGTLVMNPKPGSSQNSDEKLNSPEKQKVIPFSGTGHVLAPGGKSDRSKSVLLSMFENKPPVKPCETPTEPLEAKKNEEEANKSSYKPQNAKKDEAKSPISNIIMNKKQDDGNSNSRVCNKGASSSRTWVPKAEPVSKEVKKEVVKKEEVKKEEVVIINSDSEEEAGITTDEVVGCPVCGLQTLTSLINEHLDECTGLLSVLENVQLADDDVDFDLPNHVQCPSCGLMCPEDEINIHLDACLS